MKYPGYVDAEMQKLLDTLADAVVPRKKRRAVYVENLHAPYYSRTRYKRIA